MLDTGCSRTMVHSDRVSKGQIREGESAVVRCAHGDTVMYPMADICVELDGCTIDTVTAVSDTLPMDVLLGTDVPELGRLLSQASERAEVFMATTRAQAKPNKCQFAMAECTYLGHIVGSGTVETPTVKGACS